MALALWVGRRVRTSFKYAYGSCPLSLADCIKLMIVAERWPASNEPANSQFFLPMAHGRIWFSYQLLSIGRSPSSRGAVSNFVFKA